MLCLSVAAVTGEVPASFYECLQTPEKEEWRTAFTRHMEGKMANGTVTWVPCPPGATTIKTKLVPAVKYALDNSIKERTMRWVGCGYSQRLGENYTSTFTATPKATSIRIFGAMVMQLMLLPKKTDVPKAFTRAAIDTKMFVEQPESKHLPGLMCPKKDKNGRYYVGLLHKALEGLKQAGNLFQSLNTDALIKIGFTQLVTEPTLFILHLAAGLILILVWIDDFAIGVSSEQVFKWFVDEYRKLEGLDIKDEGPLTYFAGVEFYFSEGQLEIGQERGIERGVLRYFPQATGLPPSQIPGTVDQLRRRTSLDGCGLLKEGDDRSFLDKYPPYLNFMALVLYYTCYTRGDLMWATIFLCRFMADPNEECFISGIKLISCLYHTRKDRIRYTMTGWNIPTAIRESGLAEHFLRNFGMYATPDASWKLRQDTELNMTSVAGLFSCLEQGSIGVRV